jgi:hypothetical protein
MTKFLELLRDLKNKFFSQERKEKDTKTFENVPIKFLKDIHPIKRKPYSFRSDLTLALLFQNVFIVT